MNHHLFRVFSICVLMLLSGFVMPLWAKEGCGGDIRFAKGESSTQIRGEVKQYDFCEYVFYAQRGQELLVSLAENDRPQIILYEPVNKILSNNEVYVLPKNGKYVMRIALTRNDARKYQEPQAFTLDFTIHPPKNAQKGGKVKASETVEVASKTQGNIYQDGDLLVSEVEGIYQGVLPCPHCEGINVFLAVYDDQSYTLSQQYLDNSNRGYTNQMGTWSIDGKTLQLHPEDKTEEVRYLRMQDDGLYFIRPEDAQKEQPALRKDYWLKRG